MRPLLTLLCLLLALPVLGVLGAWAAWDAAALAVLQHQMQTVLPEYALQSLLLALGVGLGVMLLGAATAAAVTLFDFQGRRFFEWALLLPLAMPAYVLAYAWTDALQFSGPLQTALREAFGLRGALWPDIRNVGGAVLLFVLCLYPYVYLLVRASLSERAVRLMEAARLLGAPMRRRVLQVALPMARPAVAAGTALALMETLADYGVGAYFGLTPARHQSGETDRTGGISRRGDRLMRTYLFEAAASLLIRVRQDSALRTWGRALAKRMGFKQAAAAVARKLAVVMHAMWRSNTPFQAWPA